MEEKNISLTFRNDYQNMYEANYAYALLKGKLSKKYNLKVFSFSLLFFVILLALLFIEEKVSLKDDIFFIIFMLLIMTATMAVMHFVSRALNKAQIKNFCRMTFNYGFDKKSPAQACFDNEKLTLQSGYAKISVPYEEIDFVISDRLNFIFSFGGENKIRNIPKINQSPDDLFGIDNLLREKLGEKFIYKM